ncbi:LacI family DNA-binding transcriptional regulator [Vibrio sp. Isolate31]|nr:LacI family DNA-binding transcriptional regulator [Vibrio sp. Isolate31]
MKECNRLLISPKAKKVTLSDVAKAAGVSTATVSRVVNNKGSVKEKLKLHIEQQIQLLGYVADGSARALASNKSRMIGAVIPTLENAIFASGINAVEAVLKKFGYTLLVAVFNYDQHNELAQIRSLMEQGIDGLLLVGNDHLPETYALLEQREQLFVNTWAFEKNNPYPCVGFDNKAAAKQVAQHLIELGHTKFSVVSALQVGNDRARGRIAGVIEALAEHGLQLKEQDIVEAKLDIWSGRRATQYLLNRPLKERPTAIICTNDVLAFGCLIECQHLGVEVPKHISVTGFDDLPLAEHLQPSLTTVHVPNTLMGKQVAQFLIDTITGDVRAESFEIPTQFLIRNSTGAPPSNE